MKPVVPFEPPRENGTRAMSPSQKPRNMKAAKLYNSDIDLFKVKVAESVRSADIGLHSSDNDDFNIWSVPLVLGVGAVASTTSPAFHRLSRCPPPFPCPQMQMLYPSGCVGFQSGSQTCTNRSLTTSLQGTPGGWRLRTCRTSRRSASSPQPRAPSTPPAAPI